MAQEQKRPARRYQADAPFQEGDEVQGTWSTDRLLVMDQRFREALARELAAKQDDSKPR